MCVCVCVCAQRERCAHTKYSWLEYFCNRGHRRYPRPPPPIPKTHPHIPATHTCHLPHSHRPEHRPGHPPSQSGEKLIKCGGRERSGPPWRQRCWPPRLPLRSRTEAEQAEPSGGSEGPAPRPVRRRRGRRRGGSWRKGRRRRFLEVGVASRPPAPGPNPRSPASQASPPTPSRASPLPPRSGGREEPRCFFHERAVQIWFTCRQKSANAALVADPGAGFVARTVLRRGRGRE